MTTAEISTQQQRELIDQFTRFVASRAEEEAAIHQRDGARRAEAKRDYETRREAAISEFESHHAALAATYRESRDSVFFQYESAGYQLAGDELTYEENAAQQLAEALENAASMRQVRRREAQEYFTENEVKPKNSLAQYLQQCEKREAELQGVVSQAQAVVKKRCTWPAPPAPPVSPPGSPPVEYLERATAAGRRAFDQILVLQHQKMAKFLEDGWPLLIGIFAAILLAFPIWWLLISFGWIVVLGAGVVAPLVIGLGVYFTVKPIALRQTMQIVPEFQREIAQAQGELTAGRLEAQTRAERAHRQLVEKRDKALAAADADFEKTREEQNNQFRARGRQAAAKVLQRRKLIENTYEPQLEQTEEKLPQQIHQREQDFERQILQINEAYRQQRAENRRTYQQQWQALVADWSAKLASFRGAVQAMNDFCRDYFPAWESVDWPAWKPGSFGPKTIPTNGDGAADPPVGVSAIRFGHFDFDVRSIPGGQSAGEGIELPQQPFEFPAVLSYPNRASLLLEAEGDGRDAATRLMQTVMLRLLTSFPPSKVRFTIIDPVGLGQNFSAFMHLADFDPLLVNSRIWTEAVHVNQRLTDMTEHMENVIQKYLRNEFESIQDYNVQAGEVAEPLQILVIANFPANFSEEAARRLASIASSGARCGVYTLISTDAKLKMPRNFDMADLEGPSATLLWDEERRGFCWKDESLRRLPMQLDQPPADDCFTEIVKVVGQQAKIAARVEVAFSSILPPEGQWWKGDSRAEVEVPLGRAGAKKLQYMRLGKGTSQHVLISGKTGSGKSTLLNAMITAMSVHYAPTELNFYLIDFKKGVEFKAYAACRLPHAQVIAIESEREFGLSVLERLDLELKNRGDLFRKHGVQDVKGYRNAEPQAVMPRILLMIDEFQEFFTTDDKIAHESSLLLDRLVRQGRAFGIHVLLGSQTLAGAYSLARSTLGQMAVRIALQCSEADAHLILSEDNSAARLLTRPGEAIYNDANGMLEGNHPFQVVWLSDHERESYLRRVADAARERFTTPFAPIVFEGNAAANPAENLLLRDLLQKPPAAAPPTALTAWLGSAVAIKDPTNIVFRRQGGGNLLIVGQQEELALGILANAMIALAAQLRQAQPVASNGDEPHAAAANRGTQFYILDGARPDGPDAGFWQRMNRELSLGAEIASARDAGAAVCKVAAEVERRLSSSDQNADSIFLVVYNLSRFRDFKKSDDFGIGGFDDETPTSVEKQLATVLREGPSLGVHTLIWCDSFANLNRWVERATMRDLEYRVLFQMSANDSSNLMDSPVASKLGPHMAMFFSEEQGQSEKFRPYGMPSTDWFATVAELLRGGSPVSEELGSAPVIS